MFTNLLAKVVTGDYPAVNYESSYLAEQQRVLAQLNHEGLVKTKTLHTQDQIENFLNGITRLINRLASDGYLKDGLKSPSKVWSDFVTTSQAFASLKDNHTSIINNDLKMARAEVAFLAQGSSILWPLAQRALSIDFSTNVEYASIRDYAQQAGL